MLPRTEHSTQSTAITFAYNFKKTVVKNEAYGALIMDKGEVTEVEGFADLLD